VADPEQTTQTPPTTLVTEQPKTEAPVEGQKAPEQKAAEPEKAAEVKAPDAPLDATSFKLPEGFTLDEPVMKDFTDVMNKEMTRAERGQALIDLYAKAVNSASEKGSQEFANLQKQWVDQVKADSTYGGTALPETQRSIGRVLEEFGDAEVKYAFDVTGAGNHPAVVKMLAKIGKALGEGQMRSGNPAGAPRDHASIMFPNQGKQ
jgi:hypothetical protein